MTVQEFITTYRDKDNVCFAIYSNAYWFLYSADRSEDEKHFEELIEKYKDKKIKEWAVSIDYDGYVYKIVLDD